jgi:hypothetical protein
MGLVGFIKRKLIARKAKTFWRNAMQKKNPIGRAANFLSGWKSWLLAGALTAAVVFPDAALVGYFQVALEQLPGADSPAFDPKAAAAAIAFVVATIGRFRKAASQYRDGIPVEDLNSY